MVTLEFVFGPHFRGKGAHLLWHKMYDVHKTAGRSPVYIALENIGQSEADSREHEQSISEQADLFKDVPKKPYGLKDLEERLEETAKMSQRTPNDIGTKMDRLGVEMIAQIFNRPVRYIESHDTKGVKEVPRDLPLQTQPGTSYEQYLGSVRQNFKTYTDDNIQRHQVAAENLADLIREHHLEHDGHVVFFFGFEHLGLEKFIKDHLKSQNLPAQIKKPVVGGVQRTLWDDLVTKRYEKPSFDPSDEELAKARLHAVICNGYRQALAKEIAQEKGDEFNEDNRLHYFYHAEKEPEYSEFVSHSRKIVEKMRNPAVREHIETYLSQGLDIRPFMKP